MKRAPWVVHVKGDPSSFEPFEVSILRDDNNHGKESFGWGMGYYGYPNGWLDVSKIVLAEGNKGSWSTVPGLAETMLATARKICRNMNDMEAAGFAIVPDHGSLP